MRKPALFVTFAAAIIVAISSVGTGTAASAPDGGGMRVPLTPKYRGCDFGEHVHPVWGIMQAAQGEVVIRKNGNTATAEVQFANTREPGAHYEVGLIQAPRSASSPCGPGTPGTAYTGMDLDGAGQATVTVQGPIDKGTKAVWVTVERPSARSQYPAEAYSSSFLAPV